MPPAPVPLPLRLYGALSGRLARAAIRRSSAKLAAAGVPHARIAERHGRATEARPDGTLTWIHAASVGESLSALPLVTRLLASGPVLVTTGTGTSAAVMAKRLPAGALHQFAPVDSRSAVRAFLDHWQPALAVFVESEIWPTMIRETHARGTRLALVNARLSDKSLRGWTRFPASAAYLFGLFGLILTQNDRTRDGLAGILGPDAPLRTAGNLKTAIPPPGADPDALAHWQGLLGQRPLWTASSTHPGEDAPVLDAHAEVLKRHPDTLLILAPRHPERGDEVTALARSRGVQTAQRSQGDDPAPDTQVYVADTVGETGLWYRLSPITFLAGSFGDAGGHNPWEPVSLGTALLHGPNVPNAAQDYARLAAAGAAAEVAGAAALATAVLEFLDTPQALDKARAAATAVSGNATGLADSVADELIRLRDRP